MKELTRFRVYGKESCIELHGSINDTTKFHALKEFIREQNTIDFSGLETCSWHGLASLDRFFQDTKKSYKFINIPGRLYNFMRLLPSIKEKYVIDNFMLCQFELDTYASVETYYTVNAEQLATHATVDSPNVIPVANNLALDGFIFRFNPEMFQDSTPAYTFHNPWYQTNAEQAYFWICLLEYWESTLALSLDVIFSLRIGLQRSLCAVKARVEAAEAAFSSIGKVSGDLSYKLQETITWLEKQCTDIEQRIYKILKSVQYERRSCFRGGDLDLIQNCVEFIQHLQKSAHSIASLLEFIDTIEETGQNAGEKLLQISVVRKLNEALLKVDGFELSEAKINEVRKGFNIMDPLSDGKWEETKEEINKELDHIQHELGSCVVLFQSFDLLRQMLEHRQAEADIICQNEEQLLQNNDQWREVREQIYQQIKKTLVTDQEKYSFAFFLPEGYKAYLEEENKAPGDVLLF
ncbi:MAG: hypothetical protein OXT67_00605 [Zetaproteobacteria bacterium]|nr:hypothetical protein [Zetaproteobacteria bacterium]